MSAIKDHYLNTILKEIRFPFDRKHVKKELEAHLEESVEFYLIPGRSIEDAETSATQDFGDPTEIGRMLNKVHKPWLGWLWLISKYSLILLSVISVIVSTPRITEACRDAQEDKAPVEDVQTILTAMNYVEFNVVMDKMLDQRVKLKDGTLIFERAIQLENGTLILLVQQVDRFDPIGLKKQDYPLRPQGKLMINEYTEVFFNSTGLMGYGEFTVLIADGIPTEISSMTFVFQGYAEEFTIDLELSHD